MHDAAHQRRADNRLGMARGRYQLVEVNARSDGSYALL